MKPLSQRQINLLKAIVEEYTSTGEAVGSETLDKKYNLGVSPATIRNEMVRLEDLGYLKQPHTSAGRVPTPIALKLYVTELMQEVELPITESISVKERIWDARSEIDVLLQEATRVLSEKTGNLGVATTNDGSVFSSGYANILAIPEFYDIDTTRMVLTMVESHRAMAELFAHVANTGSSDTLHIILGDEFGHIELYPCAFAYIDFQAGSRSGHIGVIGPARLNYPYVMPMLRHFQSLLGEIGANC